MFEDPGVLNLFPLTRTRTACQLRAGRRTLLEMIADALETTGVVVHCRPELADVVREDTTRPVNRIAEGLDVLFINGRTIVHTSDVLGPVIEATRGQTPTVFVSEGQLVAAWAPASTVPAGRVAEPLIDADSFGDFVVTELPDAKLATRIWDLLDHIDACVSADFATLSHGINIYERPGTQISERALLVNGEQIFTAAGVQVRAGAVLDASRGPIIIDRDAVIMENVVLHGPVSIGEKSIVKVGASLELCVVGPRCKVAGEVHDSVMHSYSNKSHAGFLGNSYLGSWVNLGADTNTSNLKNDYGIVSAYNESLGAMEKTGSMFAGLVMGDHSKCGISSMFNTGTVIGVSCNLFGSGYYPRYVPSFLWGGSEGGFVPYRLEKAMEVAEVVMKRRDRTLTPAMRDLLSFVHSETESDRQRGTVR
ncbi:MAG: putative sugar nucleotidyl transferase [Rhodothermales bacterium]|nr:putative sugar nucleotidyl transferase [Rhodothermales bacterium]